MTAALTIDQRIQKAREALTLGGPHKQAIAVGYAQTIADLREIGGKTLDRTQTEIEIIQAKAWELAADVDADLIARVENVLRGAE